MLLFQDKLEADTEIEANVELVEIDTKPLVAEIEVIDYNRCDTPSISLPLLQIDIGSASHSKDDQTAANPLESIGLYESETNEMGETVFKCMECGKCMKKRWNMKVHLRTHSNERPFVCSLCHNT